MFSRAVSHGNRAASWNINAAPSLGTSRAPDVGASSPAMMFSRVDLPQPDAPSRATNSPCPMVALTSSSTGAPSPKRLPRFSSTTGMVTSLRWLLAGWGRNWLVRAQSLRGDLRARRCPRRGRSFRAVRSKMPLMSACLVVPASTPSWSSFWYVPASGSTVKTMFLQRPVDHVGRQGGAGGFLERGVEDRGLLRGGGGVEPVHGFDVALQQRLDRVRVLRGEVLVDDQDGGDELAACRPTGPSRRPGPSLRPGAPGGRPTAPAATRRRAFRPGTVSGSGRFRWG